MISLVVVNYRSAALAAEAIRTARASSQVSMRVIVVDNSCDASETDRLRAHADVLLTPARNLGYAGAINHARPYCAGPVFIVSNPDVRFAPAAVDHLVRTVKEGGFAAAGPAFFWDDAEEWILPPAELPTLTGRLSGALAGRLRLWRRRRDRSRFRRRMAFWALRETTPVPAISGAVMAIGAAAFDEAGGFDERFALYFEETDFLRRIGRAGGRVAYVPSARCRHVYNQSAGEESLRAAAAYARSEDAYFAKWYASLATRVVKSIERVGGAAPFETCPSDWELPRTGLVVEASPLASFETAAGHVPAATTVRVPPEVWESYRSDALYLRAIDPATAEVVAACVRKRS